MSKLTHTVAEVLYRFNVHAQVEVDLLAAAFDEILQSQHTPSKDALLSALLTGVMTKGPTVDEVVALLRCAFRLDAFVPEQRERVQIADGRPVIAVAGSGKKGVKTINISTPSAFVAASQGVVVAKAGSSSTSSVTGSADFIRAVGAKIDMEPKQMALLLESVGIAFFAIERLLPRFDRTYGGRFYAPHVLSFGLAALAIPIAPDGLLYGLAHPDVELALKVLREFGTDHAMVISSTHDGIHFLDEVGVYGATRLVGMKEGAIGRLLTFRPTDLVEFPRYTARDIAHARTKRLNVVCSAKALAGRGQPAHEDFICLNAGNILYLAGNVGNIRQGYSVAKEAIRSGAAIKKLYAFVEATSGETAKLDAILD